MRLTLAPKFHRWKHRKTRPIAGFRADSREIKLPQSPPLWFPRVKPPPLHPSESTFRAAPDARGAPKNGGRPGARNRKRGCRNSCRSAPRRFHRFLPIFATIRRSFSVKSPAPHSPAECGIAPADGVNVQRNILLARKRAPPRAVTARPTYPPDATTPVQYAAAPPRAGRGSFSRLN